MVIATQPILDLYDEVAGLLTDSNHDDATKLVEMIRSKELDYLDDPFKYPILGELFEIGINEGHLQAFYIAYTMGVMDSEYQELVQHWMEHTFSEEVVKDTEERNFRFLEEALELVQANGCSKEDALQLVDYVYIRPDGELTQEMGGVIVTLSALANAADLNMRESFQKEYTRIWQKSARTAPCGRGRS